MEYRVGFEYVIPEYGEMFIDASSEDDAKKRMSEIFEEDEFFEDAEELKITEVKAI